MPKTLTSRIDPRHVLAVPAAYRWFASSFWPRQHRIFANEYVRARSGDRILDVGCGPAELLAELPGDVTYVGFDMSARYVGWARTRYGNRARFFCRSVDRAAVEELGRGSFDVVVAHGVVHHLDDDQALAFFGLAHDALKKGGRLVTADGCYVPGQSWLARVLLAMDRGRFVRGEESYVRLARRCFTAVRSDIRHDTFRVPYTIIFMECTA